MTSGDPEVVRLRLDLAYDGADFSGWARQPGRRTVEQTVADALARVLRLSAAPALTVAGRTDAGVHALGQVAHVDVSATVLESPTVEGPTVEGPTVEGPTVEGLVRRLHGVLPDDVVVREATVAPPGFDARFSATGRRYRYRVSDAAPDPLRRRDTLAWPRPLDAAVMNAAAQTLLGEHDFAAYCRARAGASTIRKLRRLDVGREAAVVTIDAEADGFCHNQVRALVGALLAVGDGRRSQHWPRQVLLAGVRDPAVAVAPAHGLTLVGVDYPSPDRLAARAATTRARRSSV